MSGNMQKVVFKAALLLSLPVWADRR